MASAQRQPGDPVDILASKWDALEQAFREIEPGLQSHIKRLIHENNVFSGQILGLKHDIEKLQLVNSRKSSGLQHVNGEHSRLVVAFEKVKDENSRLVSSVRELERRLAVFEGMKQTLNWQQNELLARPYVPTPFGMEVDARGKAEDIAGKSWGRH
jgi:chromosome segregation ATPase